MTRLFPGLLIAAVLLASAGRAAAQTYTFTDLGAFEPRAIAGPWVVGVEAGLPTRLNLDTGDKLTLEHFGQGGVAASVIASGDAVGTLIVVNAQGQPENAAAFWDADGVAVLMPGPTPSDAADLNESGTAAANGPCPLPSGQVRRQAMRWWPREGRAECLVGPASLTGEARAIDGQDRVWGQFSNVVTVWEVGQPGRPLTGAREGGVQGVLRGANEVLAVGNTENFLGTGTARFGSLAAHFRAQGEATLLPAPAPVTGGTACSARGLNTALATVGACARFAGPFGGGVIEPMHAILWPDTLTLVDLNTRVEAPYVLSQAVGINDAGEIVGTSPEGNWLLRPVERVAECGGDIACQCGDRVITAYTFSADLTCAVEQVEAALVIGSGVSVHGNGFALLGTGGGIGMLFDEVTDSRLSSLVINGFAEGVKLRAGAAFNKVASVTATGNGTALVLEFVTHNKVVASTFSGEAALRLLSSNANEFFGNTFIGAVIAEDSDDNTFKGNQFAPRAGGEVALKR